MMTVTRRILVSAPKDAVRSYLQDLGNLREYDQKVERLEVTPEEGGGGFVEVSGRFLGLPWKGAYRLRFTRDGGYRKEMVRGPLPRQVGSLRLQAVTGGTLVTQEEQYHLPSLVRPLGFLMKSWLSRAAERELGVIKEGAERLHRRLQLEQIDSSL